VGLVERMWFQAVWAHWFLVPDGFWERLIFVYFCRGVPLVDFAVGLYC
jgi:hypothetical protein